MGGFADVVEVDSEVTLRDGDPVQVEDLLGEAQQPLGVHGRVVVHVHGELGVDDAVAIVGVFPLLVSLEAELSVALLQFDPKDGLLDDRDVFLLGA